MSDLAAYHVFVCALFTGAGRYAESAYLPAPFVTACTRARHLSLSRARSMHPASSALTPLSFADTLPLKTPSLTVSGAVSIPGLPVGTTEDKQSIRLEGKLFIRIVTDVNPLIVCNANVGN